MKKATLTVALLATAVFAGSAQAAWVPDKPVEFIVTAGAGGGTDTFARTVQSIIVKYKLMDAPIVVLNKGGGSGSEGFIYGSSSPNDPYKVTFGTNNEYLLPLVAKMGFSADGLQPVAAMALDEFLLWVNDKSPHKDAKSFIAAAKKPEGLKIGGSQSKDTDQTLTSMITAATGAKFTYIPFKSGGEAAVQLAGGHIDANLNNPSENLGQWKASMVRPLCIFSTERMAPGAKVTKDMGWSDIPTCKEAGVPVEYQMLRGIFMSPGVKPEETAYYVELFKKVRATPEWKDLMERGAFNQTALTGKEYADWVSREEARHVGLMKAAGFIATQK